MASGATVLDQVVAALRSGGRFLLLEPKGHVSRDKLEAEMALSEQVGFQRVEGAVHRRSHGTLFERPTDFVSASPVAMAAPKRS